MKILITGRGSSGSFQIRGVQIGRALGAVVKPMATLEDCKAADVIIAVKRVPGELLHNIRKSGRPWVYDIVDAYPQPACGAWTPAQARRWLRTWLAGLEPHAVIWPTAQMRDDACWLRGAVINHHHRPDIVRNPIRPHIQAIGYEGAEAYLAEWAKPLERACMAIGAEFVVNPKDLAELDIVVALRGRDYNGYAQEKWKSNVKLANAQGSGTPIICQLSSAYCPPGYIGGPECFIGSPKELMNWIEFLAPRETRQRISSELLRKAYRVDQAARDYRALLETVCASK